MSITNSPNDIQLQAPAPVGPRGQAQTFGQTGIRNYYYWVIARYPIGIAISGPIFVRNAPDVLSSSNYVLVVWDAPLGAVAFDILRTDSNKFPQTAGAYALGTGWTDTEIIDSGQALVDYDVTGLPWGAPVSRRIILNNRDYTQPTIEFNAQVVMPQLMFEDGSIQDTAGGLGPAPDDGIAYARKDNAWVPVVQLDGDTMTGPLVLAENPTADMEAATKQYVDETAADTNLWQGTYEVSTNTPDLATVDAHNGFSWTAVTVDPNQAEPLTIDLPGLPLATWIHNSDLLIYSSVTGQWSQVQGSSLTKAQADALYVNKTGDSMTGILTVQAGDAVRAAIQAVANQGPYAISAAGAITSTTTVQAANFQSTEAGYGLQLNGGGKVYAPAPGAVVLAQGAANQQPQIENFNGTNRRDIIDTVNGDARYLLQNGAWNNCELMGGVSGRCQVRLEQNGAVVRLNYFFNRGGAPVGAGVVATIPSAFLPFNGLVFWIGANNLGAGIPYHLAGLQGNAITVQTPGDATSLMGDVTYRCPTSGEQGEVQTPEPRPLSFTQRLMMTLMSVLGRIVPAIVPMRRKQI